MSCTCHTTVLSLDMENASEDFGNGENVKGSNMQVCWDYTGSLGKDNTEGVENIFGLKVLNPISSKIIYEFVDNRKLIALSCLKRITQERDCFIAATITRFACKKQLCMWKISDLKPNSQTAHVALKGDVCKQLCNTSVGTVIIIKHLSISKTYYEIDRISNVLIVGRSRDYSITRAGFVNKSFANNQLISTTQSYKRPPTDTLQLHNPKIRKIQVSSAISSRTKRIMASCITGTKSSLTNSVKPFLKCNYANENCKIEGVKRHFICGNCGIRYVSIEDIPKCCKNCGGTKLVSPGTVYDKHKVDYSKSHTQSSPMSIDSNRTVVLDIMSPD